MSCERLSRTEKRSGRAHLPESLFKRNLEYLQQKIKDFLLAVVDQMPEEIVTDFRATSVRKRSDWWKIDGHVYSLEFFVFPSSVIKRKQKLRFVVVDDLKIKRE